MKKLFAVLMVALGLVTASTIALDHHTLTSSTFISVAHADEAVAPSPSPAAEAPAIVPAPAPAPSQGDQLAKLAESMNGLAGGGTLAVVAFAIQLLLFLFSGPLSSLAGIYKMLIVTGLNLVAGVIALRMQGVEWIPALAHSQVLAMAQVFIHQLLTQVAKKKADEAKAV